MKKLILSAILFAAATSLFAQNAQIEQFYQKYEGKEGFTSVKITEKLFALAASATGSDPDIQNVVDGIKGIQILVFENTENNAKSGEYYREFMSTVSTSNFDELMTVNSEGDKVKFYGKMASEKVLNEMLLVCDSDGEFVMISILGEINMEDISKLSEMDIDGLEELKKVEDKE